MTAANVKAGYQRAQHTAFEFEHGRNVSGHFDLEHPAIVLLAENHAFGERDLAERAYPPDRTQQVHGGSQIVNADVKQRPGAGPEEELGFLVIAVRPGPHHEQRCR